MPLYRERGGGAVVCTGEEQELSCARVPGVAVCFRYAGRLGEFCVDVCMHFARLGVGFAVENLNVLFPEVSSSLSVYLSAHRMQLTLRAGCMQVLSVIPKSKR